MSDARLGESIGQGSTGILKRPVSLHHQGTELGVIRARLEIDLVGGEKLSGYICRAVGLWAVETV